MSNKKIVTKVITAGLAASMAVSPVNTYAATDDTSKQDVNVKCDEITNPEKQKYTPIDYDYWTLIGGEHKGAVTAEDAGDDSSNYRDDEAKDFHNKDAGIQYLDSHADEAEKASNTASAAAIAASNATIEAEKVKKNLDAAVDAASGASIAAGAAADAAKAASENAATSSAVAIEKKDAAVSAGKDATDKAADAYTKDNADAVNGYVNEANKKAIEAASQSAIVEDEVDKSNKALADEESNASSAAVLAKKESDAANLATIDANSFDKYVHGEDGNSGVSKDIDTLNTKTQNIKASGEELAKKADAASGSAVSAAAVAEQEAKNANDALAKVNTLIENNASKDDVASAAAVAQIAADKAGKAVSEAAIARDNAMDIFIDQVALYNALASIYGKEQYSVDLTDKDLKAYYNKYYEDKKKLKDGELDMYGAFYKSTKDAANVVANKEDIPDHTFDDSVKLIEGYEKAVNEADQAYTTAVGNAETAQKNADAAVKAIKENVENADNFIDDAQKKVDEAKADAETASASAIKSIEFAKAAENEYIKANDEASKANDAKTSALDELNKIIGIDGKSGLSNDLNVANGKVQENIDKVAPAVKKAEDEAKRVTDFNCELENDNPYNKPVQTAEKAVTNQIGKIEDQKKLVASKQSEIDTNNQELKKQEEIKSAANTEIINCEKKIDSADEEIGKCNTTIRKANREIFEANVAISFYGPESGYLLFGWHSTYDPEKYQDAVNKKNKAEASINDANNKIADQETIKANAKTEKENQEAIWNTADDACDTLKKNYKTLNKDLNKLNSALDDMNDELVDLNGKFDAAKADKKAVEDQIDAGVKKAETAYLNDAQQKFVENFNAIIAETGADLNKYGEGINQAQYTMLVSDWANELSLKDIVKRWVIRDKLDKNFSNGSYFVDLVNYLPGFQLIVDNEIQKGKLLDAIDTFEKQIAAKDQYLEGFRAKYAVLVAEAAKADADKLQKKLDNELKNNSDDGIGYVNAATKSAVDAQSYTKNASESAVKARNASDAAIKAASNAAVAVDDVQKIVDVASKNAISADEKAKSAEQKLREINDLLDKLSSEQEATTTKRNEYIKQASDAAIKVADAKKEYEAAKNKVTDLKNEIKNKGLLEANLVDLLKQLNKAQDNLNKAQENLDNAEKKLEEAKTVATDTASKSAIYVPSGSAINQPTTGGDVDDPTKGGDTDNQGRDNGGGQSDPSNTGSDTIGSNTSGSDTNGSNTSGSDTNSSDTSGSDTPATTPTVVDVPSDTTPAGPSTTPAETAPSTTPVEVTVTDDTTPAGPGTTTTEATNPDDGDSEVVTVADDNTPAGDTDTTDTTDEVVNEDSNPETTSDSDSEVDVTEDATPAGGSDTIADGRSEQTSDTSNVPFAAAASATAIITAAGLAIEDLKKRKANRR